MSSSIQLSIVVPTYCEVDNLTELISRISSATRAANITTEIIVVDDNSPDDTVAVCAQLTKEHPLQLIVRTEERGLSSAVIAGMQAATGEVLLCMDADLSHPPEKIPEMFHAIQQQGTDFVIGSRYVAGGSTAGDWGFFRWINSVGATLLARPFTKAKDPMAGFFAIHRDRFLKSFSLLNPVGYKIGLELIVKCDCKNVAEVPIHFSDRQYGESKLSLKEQFNYVRHLYRLAKYRYRSITQLLLFLCVGSVGMMIDLSAYALLLTFATPAIARMVAIWFAMTSNFGFNRSITFAELDPATAPKISIFKQYFAYCASCLVGVSINWLVSIGLSNLVPFFSDHKLLAAMLGIASGTVFNFLLCKMFVFNHQHKQVASDEAVLLSVVQTDRLSLPAEIDQPEELEYRASA